MTTTGFDHVYVETHNWGKAVAFWQRLGFEFEFDTGHGSGMLRHPNGGPTVFVAEQSIENPLATELYLGADADFVAPEGVEVVSSVLRDPLGNEGDGDPGSRRPPIPHPGSVAG